MTSNLSIMGNFAILLYITNHIKDKTQDGVVKNVMLCTVIGPTRIEATRGWLLKLHNMERYNLCLLGDINRS
jgi:hypothetical protein